MSWDSFRRKAIYLYSMSQTYPYPCTVCHRHIPVKNVVRHFLKHVGLGINKRLFQERSHILVQYVTDKSISLYSMSQTYPCKNVVRHFLNIKHVSLGISKNENEFSTWVSLGIFLLWSVNCSFHKRNENDFLTCVSLGIFLLGSLNHSFPKRNENDFFTWVTLGIYLLWSANHSFHKVPMIG